MKRITLVRHAKSSWKDPTLADFDRPLNKRGRRDAPAMGERLAGRGLRPDLIVSSPASRAWTTAETIAERLGVPPDEIRAEETLYGASAWEVFEIARSLDDRLGHVMIFGHNPGFTDVANMLTGAAIANVPTAGVVDVRFDVDSWRDLEPGSGELLELDFPKKA